jgi:tetratricopeptide (TPR) repeat protein
MRKTGHLVIIFFLSFYGLVGYGGAADAQQTAPQTASEATENPSETDGQYERALPYLEQGEVTFDSKNYEASLAEFERAYAILKGHPKQCETLKNIGLCHERLFRYDRALDYYRRYLAECGAAAKERDKIEQKLDVLNDLLGTLKVAANVSSEVWVDNVLIGKAPGDLLVSGGRHTVELRAVGYESEQREISIPGGSIQHLAFTLNEISEYKGISPVFFGSAAGLAVISAGIGTWFGVQALSQKSDAEGRVQKLNTAGTEDDIDSSALTADVFFATAGVFALGAGILYLFTDWGGEQKSTADKPKDIEISLRPTASKQRAGLQLVGSF